MCVPLSTKNLHTFEVQACCPIPYQHIWLIGLSHNNNYKFSYLQIKLIQRHAPFITFINCGFKTSNCERINVYFKVKTVKSHLHKKSFTVGLLVFNQLPLLFVHHNAQDATCSLNLLLNSSQISKSRCSTVAKECSLNLRKKSFLANLYNLLNNRIF